MNSTDPGNSNSNSKSIAGSKNGPNRKTKSASTTKSETRGTLLASVGDRVFLGLDRAPLVSAVDWLLQTFCDKNSNSAQCNLAGTIVVVPTARVQDRLLQLLVASGDKSELELIPPTITTIGQLPEFLYAADKPLASDLVQQIAWTKALEESTPQEIEQLTGRADEEKSIPWQPLAAMISHLHTRLANDIWSFSSVARAVAADTGFLKAEAVRWEALKSIQDRYYRILEEAGLWDKQAARNFAAGGLLKANQIRCATDRTIVMLAAADLNRSVSEMLRQVAIDDPNKVKILIAAPKKWAPRFDSFGSLITEQWLDVPIEIPDEKIWIVDRPADQAFAASYYISCLENVAADEITIGVPDETLVPQVERSLNSISLEHRFLGGRPLSHSPPVRLLLAVREYLRGFSYEAFANLIRHPDLYPWLEESRLTDDWLTDLAEFQNSHLPAAIRLDEKQPFGDAEKIARRFDKGDSSSKKRAKRRAAAADRLNRIYRRLANLLSPLVGESRPIAQWVVPWTELLIEVYGERELDRNNPADRQTIVACEAIHAALLEQRSVPVKFDTTTTAMQALEWALQAAHQRRIVAPPIPTAIELAGWLDLTLDDAPVMVVIGMNDENVPTSEVGHPFLPNELCKQLGILDNDRRFARDCYALSVITSVRNQFQLIVGRRDEQGEPLKPSRLLFADTALVSAQRATAFFNYRGKSETQTLMSGRDRYANSQQFVIPYPVLVQPVTQISVTKFREYIKCPYRFYLKHVLGLAPIADDWRELDGGKFGDLTHDCLEAFGKSAVRESTDETEILEFLNDQLANMVARQFGGARLPALKIQIEQLRLRFERFAPQQAGRRQAGWQIVSTEEMLEHDFDVDGIPFRIRGKIDRVDRHEITNQIAVWDYKSSDKGDPPDKVHYAKRKQEWKDLQLPLYRHLVKEVAAVAGGDFYNIAMGYILLPKNLADVGFHEAAWTADELATADETAKTIIRQLRAGMFWPPAASPPLYSDELAAICQDHVFEKFQIEESEVATW